MVQGEQNQNIWSRGQGNGATGVHRAFSYGYRERSFDGLPVERVYHSRTPHWVELLASTERSLMDSGIGVHWRPQSVLLWIPFEMHWKSSGRMNCHSHSLRNDVLRAFELPIGFVDDVWAVVKTISGGTAEISIDIYGYMLNPTRTY